MYHMGRLGVHSEFAEWYGVSRWESSTFCAAGDWALMAVCEIMLLG